MHLPLTAAAIAKDCGVKHFLVVSAQGANSKSWIPYNRAKGLLEEGLEILQFPSLTIARPSLLLGKRKEKRFFEALGAQKPVIAASEHWSDFFEKAGGAIIVKPRRKDSIALGIKALLSMGEADRETLGRANREFFEKNSIRNFAKENFSLFENFVKQKEIKK